jgi:hypothetical protein
VRVAGRDGYLLAWRRGAPDGPWEAFVCWAEPRARREGAAGGPLFGWREQWLDARLVERLPGQDYRCVRVYEWRGSTWVLVRQPGRA